jgi:hypothetical protein
MKRPSRPDIVTAAMCPLPSRASTRAVTGDGGQGSPMRSTGQVGPAVIVPWISNDVGDRVEVVLVVGADAVLVPQAASVPIAASSRTGLAITRLRRFGAAIGSRAEHTMTKQTMGSAHDQPISAFEPRDRRYARMFSSSGSRRRVIAGNARSSACRRSGWWRAGLYKGHRPTTTLSRESDASGRAGPRARRGRRHGSLVPGAFALESR